MKFSIIANKNKDINNFKNQILSFNSSLEFTETIDKSTDFIFVFGGDNIFINTIKDYCDYQNKFIFINDGKMGFLRSFSDNKINNDLFNESNYYSLPYLEIKIDNQTHKTINELEIINEKLCECKITINNNEFRTINSSRLFIINSLGSTGKSRSYLYPLMFSFNNYLIHFQEEPLYKYNNSLLQPLLFSFKDVLEITYSDKIKSIVKIDNKLIQVDIASINIKQNQTKMKVLNLLDDKVLAKKINFSF